VEFKFKEVDRNLVSFVENIVSENKCTILTMLWKPKYNSYVVYDYEPINPGGFNIEITIQGEAHFVAYVDYLYRKKLFELAHLEKCFSN
jgi:hypothetical protein